MFTKNSNPQTPSWERSQDFFRGGGTLFQKNFQKILKIFPKKIQKFFKNIQKNFKKFSKNFQKIFKNFEKFSYSFSIVFSQFNNAWGKFLRVWTKNAICRNFLIKFSKLFKCFLKKIAINALF